MMDAPPDFRYRFKSVLLDGARMTIKSQAFFVTNSLEVISGQMTKEGTLQVDDSLTISGGLLAGSGTLISNALFSWYSGSLLGGETFLNGISSISGLSNKVLETKLINTGSLQWLDGDIQCANGGSWVNAKGALLTVNTTRSLFLNTSDLTCAFTNNGDLLVVSGHLNVSPFFFTDGYLYVCNSTFSIIVSGSLHGRICVCDTGTLNLLGTVEQGNDLVDVCPASEPTNATVEYDCPQNSTQTTLTVSFGIVTIGPNSSCDTGLVSIVLLGGQIIVLDAPRGFEYKFKDVHVSGGLLTINQQAHFTTTSLSVQGGTISNAGMLQVNAVTALSGGSIGGAGTVVSKSNFTWSSGSINDNTIVELSGYSMINGEADKELHGQLINSGLLQWTSTNLQCGQGSIVNVVMGTLVINSTSVVSLGDSSCQLNNHGELQVISGGLKTAAYLYTDGYVYVCDSYLHHYSASLHGRICVCATGEMSALGGSVQMGQDLEYSCPGPVNFINTTVDYICSSKGNDTTITLTSGTLVLWPNATCNEPPNRNLILLGGHVVVLNGPPKYTYNFNHVLLNGALMTINDQATFKARSLDMRSGIIEDMNMLIISDGWTMSGGQVEGSGSVTSSRQFLWQDGSILANGLLQLAGTTTINGTSKTLHAYVVNSGDLLWQSGNLDGSSSILNNGTWIIGDGLGNCSMNLHGQVVTNNGRITVQCSNAALNISLTNYGTIVSSDGLKRSLTGSPSTLWLGKDVSNHGSIVSLGQSSLLMFAANSAHFAQASLLVDGTVIFTNSNATFVGTYAADSSVFMSSKALFDPRASLSFGPHLQVSDGSVNFTSHNLEFNDISLKDALIFASGALTFTGTADIESSMFAGCGKTTVTADSAATINGTGLVLQCHQLVNNGTVFWSSGTIHHAQGSGISIREVGQLLILDEAEAISNDGTALALYNLGRIYKQSTKTVMATVQVINRGLLNIKDGTLILEKGCNQTDAITLLSGGHLLSRKPFYNYDGGIVGGYGVLAGNVINSAVIRPGVGTGGKLTIDGDLVQTQTGVLEFYVGGYIPLLTYNILQVNGMLKKAGLIRVTLVDAFYPNITLPFEIITYSNESSSGSFIGIDSFEVPIVFDLLEDSDKVSLEPTLPGYERCPSACSLRGKCVSGLCKCNDGFTGDNCATPTTPCSSASSCSNHGSCGTNGLCICQSGWTGDNCSLAIDCVNDCSGHGYCLDDSTCLCDVGYSGASCELKSNCQDDSDCGSNGQCSVEGICKCQPGWSGALCSIPTLCPNNCSGKGGCVAGSCNCQPNWHGPDCSRKYFLSFY